MWHPLYLLSRATACLTLQNSAGNSSVVGGGPYSQCCATANQVWSCTAVVHLETAAGSALTAGAAAAVAVAAAAVSPAAAAVTSNKSKETSHPLAMDAVKHGCCYPTISHWTVEHRCSMPSTDTMMDILSR